jgi:hypothetical protein
MVLLFSRDRLERLGNRILNYIYGYKSSATSELDIKQATHNFEDQAERWYVAIFLNVM